MLNEVKKNLKRNPRVSAMDLQKSLEHANISVDEYMIRKHTTQEWCSSEDTMEESTTVQKKHCCMSEVRKRACRYYTALLAKYCVDRLN